MCRHVDRRLDKTESLLREMGAPRGAVDDRGTRSVWRSGGGKAEDAPQRDEGRVSGRCSRHGDSSGPQEPNGREGEAAVFEEKDDGRKRIKERLKEMLDLRVTAARHTDTKEGFAEYFFGICKPNRRLGKLGSR